MSIFDLTEEEAEAIRAAYRLGKIATLRKMDGPVPEWHDPEKMGQAKELIIQAYDLLIDSVRGPGETH